MIISGQKYLCSLDESMLMADSLPYQAVWGTVTVHKFEDVFGFIAKGHANYFYEIGDKGPKYNVIVAGCRLNKAVPCETPPIPLRTNCVRGENKDGQVVDLYYNAIYYADNIPELIKN